MSEVAESASVAATGTPGRSRGVALPSCGLIVLAGSLLLLTLGGHAGAAGTTLGPPAGSLDRAFGTGGKVVTDLGGNEWASAVAAQPDGRVVVAGTIVDPEAPFASQHLVARYLADGRLDQRFGSGGTTLIAYGPVAGANGLALAHDGKIVLVGDGRSGATRDFAVARMTQQGVLDTTFGTGGTVISDFGGTVDAALAVALQPDGKIVVAGTTRQPGPVAGTPTGFAVARYTAYGRLDTSFGRSGHTATYFEDGSYAPSGVALQPDGKVVVVGTSFHVPLSTPPPVFVLARYDADGTLDSTFGEGGLVRRANAAGSDVVVTHRKIVVGGSDLTNLALWRYEADGTVDRNFGSRGVASASGLRAGGALRIALQADGEIVAAGSAMGAGGSSDFAVARFDPNGHRDPAFGISGAQTTSFGASDDAAYSLALTTGGKIVLAGGKFTATGPADISLARYYGSVCVVPSVVSRSLAASRHAITRAGCAVGAVRRVSSARVRAGSVIRQAPSSGARRRLGTPVALVVSR